MQIVPVFGGPKTPPTLWWMTGGLLTLEALFQLADNGWLGVDLRSLAISYGGFWDFLFPPGRVDQALYPGQAYAMLLTHALLHAGTLHVIMNGVIFLALGKTLALRFGMPSVWITAGLGAISSGVMFGLLEDTAAPMVGASGVVFAFLGLWLYCAREDQRRLGNQARSITSIFIGLVVVHIVLHVFTGGMIAWQAHLGGFLAGFFVMPWLVMSRQRFGR